MIVRGFFANRLLRSSLTCILALLQVHLFWLTIFHHHEETIVSTQPATFQQKNPNSPAAVETGLVCTACQIVRNSALRPTVSPQAPGLISSVPLHLAVAHNNLRPVLRVVGFGRAPPLS